MSVQLTCAETEWKEAAAALHGLRGRIEEDTRIVMICDLPEPASPEMQMLLRCQEPEELLKPLEVESTADANCYLPGARRGQMFQRISKELRESVLSREFLVFKV